LNPTIVSIVDKIYRAVRAYVLCLVRTLQYNIIRRKRKSNVSHRAETSIVPGTRDMWRGRDFACFVARAGSLTARQVPSRRVDVPGTSRNTWNAAWRSSPEFRVSGIRGNVHTFFPSGGRSLARDPGLTGTPPPPRGVRGFASPDTTSENAFERAEKAIITAYGPDRPGLVSSLAKSVLDAGGNVENTRVARLGDDCNVMMLVSFADSSPEKRRTFAQKAEEIPGLIVKVRPTTSGKSRGRDAGSDAFPDTSRWRRIFLHGTDFKGLLHAVTSYLGEERINIETLNTDTQRAPFGDDELFTMEAVIEIGPDVSLARFKKTMDRLKRRLGVDIVVSEHESHRDSE